MKENARLIGILAFFAVLVALTWIWQRSETDLPTENLSFTDSTEQTPAPTRTSARSLSRIDDSDEAQNSREKTLQERTPANTEGNTFKKVYFPAGKGSISGLVKMNDNSEFPQDLLIVLHFITEKSNTNFQLDTSVLESAVDEKGEYRFEELPIGDYVLFAIAEGYTGNSTASVTKERLAGKRSLTVYGGSTIEGIVVDDEGSPIPDASLFAARWRQGSSDVNIGTARSRASQAVTDEEGKFTIRYLQVRTPVLEYELLASAPGYANTITPYLTPGSKGHLITLSEGQEITGTVVSAESNDPVPNVKVFQNTGTVLNQTSDTTDLKGHFKLSNIAPGSHSFAIEHKSWILKEETPPVKVVLDVPTDPVTLEVIAGGIVTGKAIEKDTKEGVANARISLRRQDTRTVANQNTLIKRIQKETTTDAHGNFRLEGLPSGRYTVNHDDVRGYARATPPEDRLRSFDHTQLIQVTAQDVTAGVFCYYRKGLQISGKIVDVNNDPIPEVYISGSSEETDSSGMNVDSFDRSNEEGRFLLAGYEAGQKVRIYTDKETYSRPDLDSIQIQNDSITGLTITLNQGAVFEGTVHDRNNAPIPSGQMFLKIKTSQKYRADIRGKGIFKIDGIAAGDYDLFYEPRANNNFMYSTSKSAINLGKISFQTGQQLIDAVYQIDIDLSNTISGNVSNTRGEPVPAAVTARGNAGVIVTAQADETGAYELTGMVEGDYYVHASHADYSTESINPVHTRSTNINFVMKGTAAVSGTVVDAATGDPIPSFELSILVDGQSYTFGSTNIQFRGFNDVDGEFTYDKIQSRQYVWKIIARAEGYSHTEYQLGTLVADETRSDVRLALTPSATIQGKVFDSEGNPISGVKIGPAGVGIQPIQFREDRFTRFTDEDGEYQMKSIPLGTIALIAFRQNLNVGRKIVSITGPGVYEVDFELGRGSTLEGYVTMGNVPVPNQQINVHFRDTSISGFRGNVRTDEDGYYRLDNLPSGSVYIGANFKIDQGTPNQTSRNIQHSLVIPESSSQRFDISISDTTASLHGSAIDSQGSPIAEKQITLYILTETGYERIWSKTDFDGNYIFESLPPGTHFLSIWNDGSSYSAKIDLGENDEKEFNVRFKGTATLVGALTRTLQPGEQWMLANINAEARLPDPSENEFMWTRHSYTLNSGEGREQEITLENLQPGNYKILALRMGPNPDPFGGHLVPLGYSIQNISFEEGDVVELEIDLWR
jgi:hypothetical protein